MTKAGFVAIIGAPNAGKSTFLNHVLGQKLAIVTPKVQTTRFNMRGILTEKDVQYIFVDTPGIHKPRRDFDRAMVSAAHNAWAEADVILFLVDALKGFNKETLNIIENLEGTKKPLLLAFNKVDKMANKERLLPLMAQAQEMNFATDVFAISALKEKGLDEVLEKIKSHLPESPFLYDADSITDLPSRLLAAEMTRERAFIHLQDELPYSVMVETESFEHKDDGSVKISQNVLIERDSQKKIVLGKDGSMIKKISTEARQQMVSVFDREVHLFLKVKVNKNWANNTFIRKEMGL